MTFLAKLAFVSSSWAPIYLLIGALLWTSHPTAAKVLFGAAALSVSLIWAIKLIVETRFASDTVKVATVRRKQDDIFMYILSYIPPFFAADLTSPPKIAALVLLYIFIFITYVRLGQYHLNPMFVFFGYHVFDVETVAGSSLHVVTRQNQEIKSGDAIRVAIYSDLALLR